MNDAEEIEADVDADSLEETEFVEGKKLADSKFLINQWYFIICLEYFFLKFTICIIEGGVEEDAEMIEGDAEDPLVANDDEGNEIWLRLLLFTHRRVKQSFCFELHVILAILFVEYWWPECLTVINYINFFLVVHERYL